MKNAVRYRIISYHIVSRVVGDKEIKVRTRVKLQFRSKSSERSAINYTLRFFSLSSWVLFHDAAVSPYRKLRTMRFSILTHSSNLNSQHHLQFFFFPNFTQTIETSLLYCTTYTTGKMLVTTWYVKPLRKLPFTD